MFQSVLQQAASVMNSSDDPLLTSIQEHYTMAGQLINQAKKQGVSGQSTEASKSLAMVKSEKDFRSKNLIKEALMENDFLKNLSRSQVR